jgi:hypothetical protein
LLNSVYTVIHDLATNMRILNDSLMRFLPAPLVSGGGAEEPETVTDKIMRRLEVMSSRFKTICGTIESIADMYAPSPATSTTPAPPQAVAAAAAPAALPAITTAPAVVAPPQVVNTAPAAVVQSMNAPAAPPPAAAALSLAPAAPLETKEPAPSV